MMETADVMQPRNMTGKKYDSLNRKQKNRWAKLRMQRTHDHLFTTVARMRGDKARCKCWCGALGPWESALGVSLRKVAKATQKLADSFQQQADAIPSGMVQVITKDSVVLREKNDEDRALDEVVASAQRLRDRRDAFSTHTVPELKAICKEKGITGFSKMTKADLVEALIDV